MSDQIINCVECLRLLIEEQGQTLQLPRYGHVGTNMFNYSASYHIERGDYVVNGTHYCAQHALPAYNAAPKFIIEETA